MFCRRHILAAAIPKCQRRITLKRVDIRLRSTLSVPADAWDSHMHVAEPDRFPVAVGAHYKPHAATLEQALDNAKRLSIPNLVFVQPSPYGYENSCLLDGLDRMTTRRGRGVVVCDPQDTPEQTLKEWHSQGVRGVRINLKSVKREMSPEQLSTTIGAYIDLIRPMRTWAIQLFIDMKMLPLLLPIVDRHREIKFVVDHFGGPPEIRKDMDPVPGWPELLELLRYDNFYVKASAPYRFTDERSFHSLEPMTKQIFEERDGRGAVFASDWPHTRHEGVDVMPWLTRCLEWCDNDKALCQRLFRENAKELGDVNT